MEYREAQEGIARQIYERTRPLNALVWEETTAHIQQGYLKVASHLLASLFTPKEIEEWKKGGYPAIVCKDQDTKFLRIVLPYSGALAMCDMMIKEGFVRIVKEE